MSTVFQIDYVHFDLPTGGFEYLPYPEAGREDRH
jgi:hypothetical protein